MSKKTEPVAKVRIAVVRDGARLVLMSRKNAKGTSNHGKLEMLGGHLDGNETPIAALVRELREEEGTGTLAAIAERAEPTCNTRTVDRSPHHLFEMTITEEVYSRLQATSTESLGFELVPEEDLASGRVADRLTYRTSEILRAFDTTAKRPS